MFFCNSFVASAGAVDEADFENAFYDVPDVKVCRMQENSGKYLCFYFLLVHEMTGVDHCEV